MRKKLGLSIAAFTAVAAFAFAGVACSETADEPTGENTCTVTFNANGGIFSDGGATIAKSVEIGGHVSDEERPSRENYLFYGWLRNEGDVVTVNLSETAIEGDTTFYAGWRTALNVTYYYNFEGAPNGGVYLTEVVGGGTFLNEPTVPARTGFEFDCWTTDAAGDNVWTFSSDKATNNVNLYAQWVSDGDNNDDGETTHLVTLHIYGQTVSHSVNDNGKFTRPEDPELEGYDFVEWRLGSIGGEAYDFDTLITADIELYAYFVEVGHEAQANTVTLHVGERTTEHNVSEGSAFTRPEDPELEGYDFVEWRLGSLDGEAYDFASIVTGNVDLYAYFEQQLSAGEHNITYVLDDGTSTVAVNAEGNPATFTEGTAVMLNNPTRPAYTFEGWYTDAEFTNKVTAVGASETRAVTLYAKWAYNYPFFVTGVQTGWANYSALKGSTDAGKKEDNALYPLIIGEGAERTWDGKTFVANRVQLVAGAVATHSYKIINSTTWFGVNGSSAGNAANLVADTNGYYTVTIEANANFTTVSKIEHKLRRFTVSFDMGDSNMTLDSIEYKDGGNVEEPTVIGCTVSAWYKDAAKTQPWSFDNDTVTEDITLYAGDITADEYSVAYPANPNLTWNAAVTKVSFGGTLDLSYTLAEAYSRSQVIIKINGKVVEDDTYAVTTTGDIEITVSEIVKNKYTVSFYEKDGTKISEVVVEHGKNATAPTAATRIGERFTGWSGALANITSDVELTAVYSFIDYKITFESNGGTKVSAIINAHYGDKVARPTGVVKTDCVLDGWFIDADLETEWSFDEDTVPARNITLYAKWREDESINWYNITFNLFDGGAKYTSTKVSENGTVGRPADPHRDGYVFDDKWYDADGNEYEFGGLPTGDITLYAGWTLDAPEVSLDGVSGEYTEAGYALTATTSHEVDGVTYAYKWYKDGAFISGATSAILTVNNVSDSGEYKVVVTANDGTLTSAAGAAIATVTIEKATLPAIENILFKDGDAYSNKITFEAEGSALASGFTVSVLDGENNVVETVEIAIDERECDVTSALVGSYTVKIAYRLADGADANIQNVVVSNALTFKGAGTAECPFVVATANDLKNVGKYNEAHFVQTADISGITQSSSLFTSTNAFVGVYDGGGYSVGKVTSATGLFGYIGVGGTVKNVNVTVAINSGAAYIGGLVAENNGAIQNVTVSGSIVSAANGHNDDALKLQHGVGGIAGKNRKNAVIDGCTNSATVRGNVTVGGIVGYNMAEATVTGCTNNGALGTASAMMSWAGGLVGLNGGVVSRSTNTANLTAPTGESNGNNYLSGLVAENTTSGVVSECVNGGEISGDYASAGLVSKNSGTVEYCINNGNVKARWTASGGACLDNGTITKCIITGTVTVNGGDNTSVNKTGTATYCYNKNGTKATGATNAKYDVSTTEKAIAILDALGDKFVYDGANIVLEFDRTACVVTFTVKGERYKSFNIVAGVKFDLTSITEPTDELLSFRGWYVADNEDKTHITEYTVESDAEIVADMGKKQFIVSFDADGGAEVESIKADYDAELTAPTTTKDGYAFDGWYADGAETPFDFTAERRGDVVLKAEWTAVEHTITLTDSEYKTLAEDEKTIAFTIEDASVRLPSFDPIEVDGTTYYFNGWIQNDGDQPFRSIDVAELGIAGDEVKSITLSQVWSTERTIISIASEADLAIFDGLSSAEIADMEYELNITDTSSALYGKTIVFITSLSELTALNYNNATPGDYYYQTVDIEIVATQIGNFTSTATEKMFRSVYNGGGHTIHFVVQSGTTYGLFNTIGATGVVKNLTLNVNITPQTDSVFGALAAISYGVVENVTVTGEINLKGNSSTRGHLIGKNNGAVRGCTSEATDTSTAGNTKLVGKNENGGTVED